ncbi:hypothetical protein D3C87_2195360 [compost metagenome]
MVELLRLLAITQEVIAGYDSLGGRATIDLGSMVPPGLMHFTQQVDQVVTDILRKLNHL